MSIMFFKRQAGSGVGINEEEGAILINTGVPQYVTLPLELGGGVLKVLDHFEDKCPVTGVMCRHLILENGLFVAESNKFHWYRRAE